MKRRPILYVVIPLLNEEAEVPSLVESLKKLRSECSSEMDCWIIIIDDGSLDATVQKLKECSGDLDLMTLSHSVNRGPGAAFGTAFEYIAGKLENNDWVVTMEGDNTSRVTTLLQMITRCKEGYDVVLASPYAYGGGVIGVEHNRVFLSHCANALAKTALGLRGLHTLSSFFRLYGAPVIKKLQAQYGPRIIEFSGFECMVELLLKLVLIEAKMSEVEMKLDWSGRRGKSKMKRLKAIGGYLRLLRAGRRWRVEAGKRFWKQVQVDP